NGTCKSANGERLAQQLMSSKVAGLALADVARHEQNGEVPVAVRFQVADELGSGHLGHDHVGDDKVENLRVEELDRFGSASAGDRLIIEILERSYGGGADSRVILDQKDSCACDVNVAIPALVRRM